ncbi:D-glycerate dehydrogenase [Achromobacter sp. F4_2707]|uniref:2-hydroxyacid dehydrogenase n=1 Tax=Achromobacter sp. F4_2707 TaxID=3114286 RepID=UPI0039C6BB52
MTDSPHVFVACDLPESVQALFVERFQARCNDKGRTLTAPELLEGVKGKRALVITATDCLSADIVAQLPDTLEVVCTYSIGMEHMDIDALKARGIAVLATPDVLSESCADTAFLLMLGAARRVLESSALLRSGEWTGWTPRQLLGVDVWGRRLGILGMGRIGRAIAQRARGFGMEVHYHNRNRLAEALEAGAIYHDSLPELAAQSDFFCIACPSSPATRGLVNTAIISRLPPQAVVCNIARGDIIDDAALVEALESGAIAAAGLDVFAGEPDIHPAYRRLPNVFGLPHIGSATESTRLAMGRLLCDGLQAYFSGAQPSNRVA